MKAEAELPLEVFPSVRDQIVSRILLGAIGNAGERRPRLRRRRLQSRMPTRSASSRPPRAPAARPPLRPSISVRHAAPREQLDLVAVLVAGREVHGRVRGRGAQNVVDQADAPRENSSQSNVDIQRMLVMMLRTVALASRCAWCSWATAWLR